MGLMAFVIVLHELYHRAAIRAFGETPRYGLDIVYAYIQARRRSA